MDKLICKHCGNVVYKSEDNIMNDVEFHDDKPYDVTYIECPKCGKSIYLYNEFEESSETIEKQLTDDTIINGRLAKLDWESVKLVGELIEPSRVESGDSKCQASIYEALGIPQELNGGNWRLLSKPRGLRWKVRHFLLMRKLRKIGEDIVQKVEE